jgi:hypothetical protein
MPVSIFLDPIFFKFGLFGGNGYRYGTDSDSNRQALDADTDPDLDPQHCAEPQDPDHNCLEMLGSDPKILNMSALKVRICNPDVTKKAVMWIRIH